MIWTFLIWSKNETSTIVRFSLVTDKLHGKEHAATIALSINKLVMRSLLSGEGSSDHGLPFFGNASQVSFPLLIKLINPALKFKT